jgi:hypothetical protein
MNKTVEGWIEESGSGAEFNRLMRHPILVNVLKMLLDENGPGLGLAMAQIPSITSDFKYGYVSGKADFVARLYSLTESIQKVDDLPSTYAESVDLT